MRKIPTLFQRDPADMSRVLPEVNPLCKWVIDGEGTPTRKYDGTCTMLDDQGRWWSRREVGPNTRPPEGFQVIDLDEVTGKRFGWVPIAQSSFAKFHAQALANCPDDAVAPLVPGTYELVGPRVNGNPEELADHLLISHARAARLDDAPRTFDGLRRYLLDPWFVFEGIVWHHPDGRMAKIKRRDFGWRRAANR